MGTSLHVWAGGVQGPHSADGHTTAQTEKGARLGVLAAIAKDGKWVALTEELPSSPSWGPFPEVSAGPCALSGPRWLLACPRSLPYGCRAQVPVAIPPLCACVHVASAPFRVCSSEDTSRRRKGPPFSGEAQLTPEFLLQRPSFQTRSHRRVSGARTSACLLEVWGDTIQRTTGVSELPQLGSRCNEHLFQGGGQRLETAGV